VITDAEDPGHDAVRQHALWGNLIGGGSGAEWYFGYKHPHNDLNCEDWRSRETMWAQTRIALDFFLKHLPLAETVPADEHVSRGWCLARPGEVYAVYLPDGGTAEVGLGKGTYAVSWYDPRQGGALQAGSVRSVKGPGAVAIGNPPRGANGDWAALVKKTDGSGEGAQPVRRERAAAPASGGGGGGGKTGKAGAVESFTLIDAETDKPVPGFDPIPDGAVLRLGKLPSRRLNIRANATPGVGSIRFTLDGGGSRTESTAPFALEGDTNGDYKPWTPSRGRHKLTATPYAGGGGGGAAGKARTITFRVEE
jgi:hypothetical protein